MKPEEQQREDYFIIKHILKDKVHSVSPIMGRGEVNRVYIVEQDMVKVVIRLHDATELQRFKKEAWCIEQATQKGISSPAIIDLGEINNTAFMLLSFVPGLNGNEIQDNAAIIWQQLGIYAKKIHTVKVEGFGENMISPGHFNDSWERYVNYNIESLNQSDKLLKMDILTPKQQEHLQSKFSKLLEKQFQFGLTHRDISFANILVNKDVITLIDWGSAEVHITPHLEIIGILEDSLKETDSLFTVFLQGYGMTVHEYEQMKPDIETLILLQSIDKLRWAIDRSPGKVEAFVKKVVQLVNS